MRRKYSGVGVALITPFKKDSKIDYPSLKKLILNVLEGKVDYLVVNGTTSEASTIELDEKLDILDFVCKNNKSGLPIMYGIGANSTKQVLDLIQKTNFDCIDSILTVSPYYNKPSQRGIYEHYIRIAEESPVPVVMYNVPGRTGSNMIAETTLRLAEHPNIIGIKEASGDMHQCIQILRHKPEDFSLISGDDMLTVPLMALGASGVISVLANAFPLYFAKAINAIEQQNFKKASEILNQFIDLNPLLYDESNPVGIKEVLSQMGICSNYVRLPLMEASKELSVEIKETLDKIIK